MSDRYAELSWAETLDAIEAEHGPEVRAIVEREASADAAAAADSLRAQRQRDRQRVFKPPAGPSFPLGGSTWSTKAAKGAATRACGGTRVHHQYVDGVCDRCGYVRRST